MNSTRPIVFGALLLASAMSSPAAAQQPGQPYSLVCEVKEFVDQRYLCKGQVRFEQGDVTLFADELEFFESEDRAIATGNVVFTQGRNQIAAERAEFNTKTRLGTFHAATGTTNIKPQRRPAAAPGMLAAPQMTNQDTEVYFFGEIVKKLGPKKYEITNGGFTTCVQPTARWDLHAGSITLNVDDYALLWNSAFNVKGVPLLYLPVMYYPISENGRSTGFLLPTWGTSNVNGQSIGNQFFWAIDRSQDLTFMHDWYSKLGQGAGAEYRYNIGTGAGHMASYVLNEDARVDPSGVVFPAERSFKILGSGTQTLPHRFRSRADVNYFSSVSTHQAFMTNVADSSSSTRSYGGNVAGTWNRYSLNGTFRRTEYFSNLTNSGLTGDSPTVSVSQSEHPLFGPRSPLYFGFSSEYAHLDRQTRAEDVITDDRTLGRIDLFPRIRYPFKRWQWMTVNSSMTWRDTFYTRSQDPVTGLVLNDDLNRQYFTFQAEVAGPAFNRVWDTPELAYAEKFKHTVEPFFALERTTDIPNFDRVVSGVDGGIVGGVTRYSYGINNRLYAKRRIGQVSQAQQILSVSLGQTYYTDARAASLDPRYATSFNGAQSSHFSPFRVDVNASPTAQFNGTLQAEIDPQYRELRSLSIGGRHVWSGGFTNVSWGQRFFIEGLPGFDDPNAVSRSLNASTTAHTRDLRYGGTYTMALDAVRGTILNQGVQGYYNAQCCGFSFQYSRNAVYGSANNNKFLFSFTLAGLGSFSPFDGGLSGVPR